VGDSQALGELGSAAELLDRLTKRIRLLLPGQHQVAHPVAEVAVQLVQDGLLPRLGQTEHSRENPQPRFDRRLDRGLDGDGILETLDHCAPSLPRKPSTIAW
jgi:hypothetical protein